MSTLQRIEAISKELSGMAEKEDFVFIYGELIRRVRADIERHGYTEAQAIDQLQVLSGFDSLFDAQQEIEKLEVKIDELQEDDGTVSDLRSRLDKIQTIANY